MTTADIRRVLERAEPGPRKAHKRHVMESALDCFEREGLDAATVEQIRAHAGSSIGSIYHHFGNKDGLVAALFFAAMDDEAALAAARLEQVADARAAVQAVISTYLEWVSEQPRLARFLFRARAAVAAGPFGEALRERNRVRHAPMRHWLARGIEDGTIRELPKETYVPLLIGQSETYCRAWLSERVRGKPSDHAALFGEAAWKAIAA